MSSGDYNNTISSGSACSYSALGSYTDNYSMNVPVQGRVTSGAYVVPTWAGPSYNTLEAKGGQPSCVGYANIGTAYGEGASSCQNTTYRASMCGSQR
jgi:hypothetical protein